MVQARQDEPENTARSPRELTRTLIGHVAEAIYRRVDKLERFRADFFGVVERIRYGTQ